MKVRQNRVKKGRRAEEMAAEHLRRLGYTILERNYRCRLGEVDIVAREGEQLVFVEVRARASDHFGQPEESVDGHKRERLFLVASSYITDRGLAGPGEPDCRFDVVAITWPAGGPPHIEVIRAAF